MNQKKQSMNYKFKTNKEKEILITILQMIRTTTITEENIEDILIITKGLSTLNILL